MKNRNEINMTRGRLFPKLLLFALPLMLSGMLQIAFNAADLIVVGRFGRPTALAAVGSNGSLVNLVINVLMGLGTGGGVLCARHFGAGEPDKLRRVVATTLIVGAVGGILVGGFGAAMAVPLLRLIGSPDDVAPLAAVYLRIYFCGMPVIALYNFAGAALRSLGNTRQPLHFLALAGVLNVLLNLFFVLVVGIDVAGVALATVLSQCVSCFLTVRCLLRSQNLCLRDLRFSRIAFGRIVAIGLPAGIQGSLFSVSNFIIQSSVNAFGAAVIAGNAACISLEGFIYCCQDASQQAATTAVSQNVGAQEYKRTRAVVAYCQALVIGLTLILSAVVLLFRTPLLRLYTTDKASLDAALVRMMLVITTYSLDGTMAVQSGANRGLGFSTLPTVVTFLGVCVFRIIWIYTVYAAHRTLGWLYMSYPISWVITTLAHLVCYYLVRKKPFVALRKA